VLLDDVDHEPDDRRDGRLLYLSSTSVANVVGFSAPRCILLL